MPKPTPYSTVARADSFYKIYEDFMYLRLNPELDMNRFDSGSLENLQLTRDSTGQIKNYYAKIAYGFEDAKRIVLEYLAFTPKAA